MTSSRADLRKEMAKAMTTATVTISADDFELLEQMRHEIEQRLDVDQEPGGSPHVRPWGGVVEQLQALERLLEQTGRQSPDSARLDWLGAVKGRMAGADAEDGTGYAYDEILSGEGHYAPTLRAAIDAAMAASTVSVPR